MVKWARSLGQLGQGGETTRERQWTVVFLALLHFPFLPPTYYLPIFHLLCIRPLSLSSSLCPWCQWAVWRHIAAPLVPAELWKGFGGDGINETWSQEPHFAVARGDVLLRFKLFSPKISQQPSRQDWWQEATCHLWPATPPSCSALHIPAILVVTTQCGENTAQCPERKTTTDMTSFTSLKKIYEFF